MHTHKINSSSAVQTLTQKLWDNSARLTPSSHGTPAEVQESRGLSQAHGIGVISRDNHLTSSPLLHCNVYRKWHTCAFWHCTRP